MTQLIMVVEDEQPIRDLVRRYLEHEGYRVCALSTVEQAKTELETVSPDLIVLDIMLPGEDGLTFCRSLRQHTSVPVIFVSARQDEIDRIVGLDLGGDDYLAKPFSPRELVARIRSVLRRTAGENNRNRTVGDVTIRPEERRAFGPKGDLGLTGREFEVLEYMVRHLNHAVSRDRFLDRVWGYSFTGETRVVDDVIKRLRRKLSAGGSALEISTIWGFGYRVDSREG